MIKRVLELDKDLGKRFLRLLPALIMLALFCSPLFAEIGDEARKRASEAMETKEVSHDGVVSLIKWTVIILSAAILFAIVALNQIFNLTSFVPLKKINADKANAVLFAAFCALFMGFCGYELVHHGKFVITETNSIHGAQIDTLMHITMALTGFVFVVIQIVLFYFVYVGRTREGRVASYYHDNSKLETIWTIIPAVAMAIIVIYGLTVWHNIHNPDIKNKKVTEIELVAEQFQWRLRHEGADGKLGKAGFKFINANNPVGIDSTDASYKDDIVPSVKEIHLPVNQPVRFKIRSKDVLHGVFAPHFAVNLYAVPGMPTQFTFTPTKTTSQMRKDRNDPKFNYELACSQLCGVAHYNMRVVLVVDTPEEYAEWLKKSAPAPAEAKATPADSTAKDSLKVAKPEKHTNAATSTNVIKG